MGLGLDGDPRRARRGPTKVVGGGMALFCAALAGRGIVSTAGRPVDSPVSGPGDTSADPGLGHDGAGLERVAVADYQVGGLAWGEASGAGSVK